MLEWFRGQCEAIQQIAEIFLWEGSTNRLYVYLQVGAVISTSYIYAMKQLWCFPLSLHIFTPCELFVPPIFSLFLHLCCFCWAILFSSYICVSCWPLFVTSFPHSVLFFCTVFISCLQLFCSLQLQKKLKNHFSDQREDPIWVSAWSVYSVLVAFVSNKWNRNLKTAFFNYLLSLSYIKTWFVIWNLKSW